MLTRLYLVRHGEVDSSWHPRIYGCLDIPLSAKGERQAHEAAARLTPEAPRAVISSDLSRAIFGARRIAEPLDVPLELDPRLREIDRGEWAGKLPAELIRGSDDPWSKWRLAPVDCRPPGGESLRDLAQRVLPRLDHWATEYPGQSIAIVAHLWVLRVAVCASLGVDWGMATSLSIATGEIVVIDWPASEPRAPRPTLVGFGIDSVPPGRNWYRSPSSEERRPTGR